MFESIRQWLGRTAVAPAEPGDPGAGQAQEVRCLEAYRAGMLQFKAGALAAAEQHLRQALGYRHDLAEAHFYLGLIYRKQARLDDARDALLLATAFKPDFADAWLYLGVVALDRKMYEEAEQSYKTALGIRPDYAEAYNGLGKMCEMLSQFSAAADYFKKAIELDPCYALAYSNLAYVTLREFFDVEAALGYVHKALELNPQLAAAHNNLAMILQFQGRCEEALAACSRALELGPASTDTLWIRALAQLMLGQFGAGWRDYESRRHKLRAFNIRKFPYREWDGSPLAGRDVLIYHEQGIGDEIMFASCLPDIFALGGRYVVECSAKLEKLFRRSFATAAIQVSDQWQPDMSYLAALPRFDWQVAAGSLPGFFRHSWDDFPAHRGYLVPNADRVRFWRAQLDKLGPGRKIGLSWRGGLRYTNQSGRSIELEALLPLLSVPGHRFVSLQYGDCADELEKVRERHGCTIHHYQEAIDDYDETAALVSALDQVISVQTAVVHLSGALGKPVWVMVPLTPEWRYMAHGERMPWYPAARIFRQSRQGEWGPVIAQVVSAMPAIADCADV